jgi:hypothetical protein
MEARTPERSDGRVAEPVATFHYYNSRMYFPVSMKSEKAAVLRLRVMKSAA